MTVIVLKTSGHSLKADIDYNFYFFFFIFLFTYYNIFNRFGTHSKITLELLNNKQINESDKKQNYEYFKIYISLLPFNALLHKLTVRYKSFIKSTISRIEEALALMS